jgi:hypothetical protein
MPDTKQTYANHTRQRRLYLAVYAVFVADIVWTTMRAVQAPSTGTVLAVLTSMALLVMAFYARVFALTVQDRVIRLEMRLRLRELLPSSMQARIGEFTVDQLVALRFASDAELPELAERVLRDKIQDRKAIKLAIKDWQGDYLRA